MIFDRFLTTNFRWRKNELLRKINFQIGCKFSAGATAGRVVVEVVLGDVKYYEPRQVRMAHTMRSSIIGALVCVATGSFRLVSALFSHAALRLFCWWSCCCMSSITSPIRSACTQSNDTAATAEHRTASRRLLVVSLGGLQPLKRILEATSPMVTGPPHNGWPARYTFVLLQLRTMPVVCRKIPSHLNLQQQSPSVAGPAISP